MSFSFDNHPLLKQSQVSNDELTWLPEFLVPEERALLSFMSARDSVCFTNKRLLLRDVQGVSGSKVEQITIPYRSVLGYATETASALELTSSVTILVRESGALRIEFVRNTDMKVLEALLSRMLLLG